MNNNDITASAVRGVRVLEARGWDVTWGTDDDRRQSVELRRPGRRERFLGHGVDTIADVVNAAVGWAREFDMRSARDPR